MNAIAEIGILVFREGLECILVLAAVTAGLRGTEKQYQRPIWIGVGIAFLATLITWCVAVRIVNDLSQRVSALSIQAGTGLLAIVVLLLVMNWFFHKLYWTGWISLHNQRRRYLLNKEKKANVATPRIMFGMALLGFTSLYREGFEVVLFLQGYRLKLGEAVVLYGVALGALGSGMVAIATFIVHRRMPYRRMLITTGILLGGVLLVMVGEEAQEMQLARWLSTTEIPALTRMIPSWTGMWFSVFPTVETLTAQVLAGLLVVGSYISAQTSIGKRDAKSREEDQGGKTADADFRPRGSRQARR